jgi:hypothetical protein
MFEDYLFSAGHSLSAFEATLHGVSRGDSSPVFRCFWVFRLNPEEGKRGNFRYD